jgi:predicted N-acetyltransferase YhbS
MSPDGTNDPEAPAIRRSFEQDRVIYERGRKAGRADERAAIDAKHVVAQIRLECLKLAMEQGTESLAPTNVPQESETARAERYFAWIFAVTPTEGRDLG